MRFKNQIKSDYSSITIINLFDSLLVMIKLLPHSKNNVITVINHVNILTHHALLKLGLPANQAIGLDTVKLKFLFSKNAKIGRLNIYLWD